MIGRRRWVAGISAVLVMAMLGWAGWTVVGGWRVRAGLAFGRDRMKAGDLAAARDRLAGVAAWWPRNDEVAFLLGECEARLGHSVEALSAWRSIREWSPMAGPARLAEGRLLVRNLGRLGDAERSFRAAIESGGTVAMPARWALAELLLWEGRVDEMRGLLRQIVRLGSPVDRAAALREHWRLDSVVVAEEELKPILDRSDRNAQGDPYGWLAHAELETRYGRYDDARRWLDRCDAARMVDPRLDAIVSRALLRWAMASGSVEVARRELARLPAYRFDPSEIWAIRAWDAARSGDRPAERSALERLVAIEPGDTRALDRLAELARLDGKADRAAEIRKRQEQALRDREAYRRLLVADRNPIPIDDLRERARLAEQLGRRFEAEGWLMLLISLWPTDPKARAELDRLKAQPDPSIDGAMIDHPLPAPSSPETRLTHRAAVAFRDDAAQVGLRFTYQNGRTPEHQIPETIGGGVAVLDYDGDGWFDLYAVQGGRFPPLADNSTPSGDRLFRNRGDGTFEDATDRAGLSKTPGGFGFGVTAGDIDNDGHPDLFVTRWQHYALYRNRGDGTFEDITDRAGLGGIETWPDSTGLFDLDGDGDLDMYVCHYLNWDADHPRVCRDPALQNRVVSCPPLAFSACSDHLFRNDSGRFVDVTEAAGIIDRDGRGLGVVAADIDDDGRVDLFVANDMTANYLWHNLGGMRFEEVGHSSGVASNSEGGYQAGMGVACGDLDGDGRPDLVVTNFFGESTTFYRNLGGGMFADATSAVGLKAPSRFLLGFGVGMLDVDNDGHLDLATANGHIHDLRPGTPYAMPAQLLLGGPDGRLVDATRSAGDPWTVPRIGRGLAVADLDNDGRMDVLIVAQESPLAYFHNQTPGAGHFLTFQLEGTTSNREAIGARVTVTAGGRRRVAWRTGGGSYASSSDPRLHFGLGSASSAESVEIRWPSGQVQRFGELAADRFYRVREGDPRPRVVNRPASRSE